MYFGYETFLFESYVYITPSEIIKCLLVFFDPGKVGLRNVSQCCCLAREFWVKWADIILATESPLVFCLALAIDCGYVYIFEPRMVKDFLRTCKSKSLHRFFSTTFCYKIFDLVWHPDLSNFLAWEIDCLILDLMEHHWNFSWVKWCNSSNQLIY